ncbi:MAG: glycoside hydrolase family 26 protein [Acidimicrobiia bacterium]
MVRMTHSWRGGYPLSRVSAFLFLLATSVVDPAARADHDGDVDSLYYEPHAGWTPPPRSPGRLAPTTGALMGVHSYDDDHKTPEEQGIVELERTLGRTMDINNRYEGDFEEFAEEGAMSWIESWNVDSGRIPLVGWGCTDSDRINNGSLNDVIRRTAQVMKAFGHEFLMRYCWEMDGSRKQGEVKGAKKFVMAWQRMHRIFQEEAATNVIWVWTPNAAGFKDDRGYTDDQPPAPFFYPGDDYVDWIAADGYNWGVSKRDQGDRWRHVIEIFDEFMVFARQHPKPIMIGEYGAQEQSADPEAKPHWFRVAHQAFMDLPRTETCPWCGVYSDVAAVVYFDVDYGKHGDWRIMSSPESTAAYKEASDDLWFHQVHTTGWAPAVNRQPAA